VVLIANTASHQYDEEAFNKVNASLGSPLEITYLQPSLNIKTVALAKGHKAVSLFVNDTADAEVSFLARCWGGMLIVRCRF
jgi:hypothetical protein